jgi:N-acetylglutamate synthase-like GNAT family acetyltransferase
MIRQCHHRDIEILYSIINEAAQKYKGVIPDDCWKIPYMPEDELKHEIDEGVVFWGFEVEGELIGVMGIQHIQDVTLIRHAYVRPAQQHQGIGKQLLAELCRQTDRPMLIPPGKGSVAQKILVDFCTADRNFYSSRRQKMVRCFS